MDVLVYVAGPLTEGDSAGHIRRRLNMIDAVDVGEQLWNAGIFSFVPHISEAWNELHEHSYQDWIDWCLTILSRCDILYRMPGESLGAEMEVRRARELGMPVYTDIEELILDWGKHDRQRTDPRDLGNEAEGRGRDTARSCGPLWCY